MNAVTRGRTAPRAGFTLVEMLVSTALIIFVMLILTTVFSSGLQALRNMRGVGSMQDQLRQAATVLRRDLAAPHFSRETTGTAGPSLSQQRLDLYDWTPPKEGFFRIWQGAPSYPEGGWASPGVPMASDHDQLPSFVIDPTIKDASGAIDPRGGLHYLHFTIRSEPTNAQGSGRDRYFATQSLKSLPAASYSAITRFSRPEYLASDFLFYSPWAEVAYFLQPSGQSADLTPLYTFYRRRRVVVDMRPPNVLDANYRDPATLLPAGVQITAASAAGLSDVSIAEGVLAGGNPSGIYSVNTPSDVTKPFRRFGMNPSMTTHAAGVAQNLTTRTDVPYSPNTFYPLYDPNSATSQLSGGDDVLLENVVSFEVKASWDVTTDSRIDRRQAPGGAAGIVLPRPFRGVQPMTPTGEPADPVNFPGGTLPNPDYPFDDLPAAPAAYANTDLAAVATTIPRVFDTWTNTDFGTALYSKWATPQKPYSIPLRIRVKAIQIRLRVWDAKTQQTRQITIVQDL